MKSVGLVKPNVWKPFSNEPLKMTWTCFLRAFTSFYNSRYGNCYTFNSGWNASEELLEAYRPGPQYGEWYHGMHVCVSVSV